MTPKIRIINDPNEDEVVVKCREGWKKYDHRYMPQRSLYTSDVARWENGKRVKLVPRYEIDNTTKVQDLTGWCLLTDLEKTAIDGLVSRETLKETAERVGRTKRSIERARWRGRKKLNRIAQLKRVAGNDK